MGNARLAAGMAVLVWWAIPSYAELKIEKIQTSHGLLGPERKTLNCYHQEEVFFRYLITGVQPDEEGKVNGELTMTLTGPDGKEVVSDTTPVNAIMALGGDSIAGSAFATLAGQNVPGKYLFTVKFTDNQSRQSAMFQKELNLRPAEFAIITPRFFYDKKNEAPAPVGGMLGQTLFFRFQVIGFDRSQNKVDAVMKAEVLDAAGKKVVAKPLQAEVRNDDPEVVKKAPSLNFSGHMALNRSGTFVLRFTVTDRLGKETTQFEAPLRVIAP